MFDQNHSISLACPYTCSGEMHVMESSEPGGLPPDSLSKAMAAASKVNALLIASGKLKPTQATVAGTGQRSQAQKVSSGLR